MKNKINIPIRKKEGHQIQKDMIGLFFEDINYAADGGLYAEMIENRSFEFVKAYGDTNDYWTEYDGGYGWSAYPDDTKASLRTVTGSPLCEENPHYMRVTVNVEGGGLANKAYDGICLKKGMEYRVSFFARCVSFQGTFNAAVVKDGNVIEQGNHDTLMASGGFYSSLYNSQFS